jgi:hypothetical protein
MEVVPSSSNDGGDPMHGQAALMSSSCVMGLTVLWTSASSAACSVGRATARLCGRAASHGPVVTFIKSVTVPAAHGRSDTETNGLRAAEDRKVVRTYRVDRPQLVGYDLHDGWALPSSAVQLRCWSRPMTNHPAALSQGLRGVLGLVAPRTTPPAPYGPTPPWAWWENQAPATRAAGRPVPGSSRRVFLHRVGRHR